MNLPPHVDLPLPLCCANMFTTVLVLALASGFTHSSSSITLVTESLSTNDLRTVSSLVLSCIFTLVLSIWCCVRPDFPSPRESKFEILKTRLHIVFWVFIAPELVLYWAFRQWWEAGKIAKEYRGESLPVVQISRKLIFTSKRMDAKKCLVPNYGWNHII